MARASTVPTAGRGARGRSGLDGLLFAPAFVGASREEAIRLALELQERYPAGQQPACTSPS